jgi:hypothetical protein
MGPGRNKRLPQLQPKAEEKEIFAPEKTEISDWIPHSDFMMRTIFAEKIG